jgi:hypothetical protein
LSTKKSRIEEGPRSKISKPSADGGFLSGVLGIARTRSLLRPPPDCAGQHSVAAHT